MTQVTLKNHVQSFKLPFIAKQLSIRLQKLEKQKANVEILVSAEFTPGFYLLD